MANPRQLDFTDVASPSTRKSLRKRSSKHSPAPEAKKKKLAPPVTNRIWNEEDELTVLKGLLDYEDKKGVQPNRDWDAFYRFIGGSIAAKFSKDQLCGKIRKLKQKYLLMEKENDTPCDSEAFRLSRMIWGHNDSESAKQSKSSEEPLKDDNQVANAEHLNENVAVNIDVGGNDTVDDESSTVRDAFETIMSRGLSDHQKKVQLENLMNIGAGIRKELSDEWKELCADEAKLNIKKFKFSAKIAEASTPTNR